MKEIQLSRRGALRLIGLCALSAALEPLCPQEAEAWSAVWLKTTHDYVLQQAYAALLRDPAFGPMRSKFPSLEKVRANEGAEALWGNGAGPDAAGKSTWSEHYYNSATEEGGGPDSTRDWFEKLYKGMIGAGGDELAKAAAYSAHYIADMHVPFHTLGMSAKTWSECGLRDLEDMEQKYYGDLRLCYGCALAHKTDFIGESSGFRGYHEENAKEVDWFDPWYFNGAMWGFHSSSHVAWEAKAAALHADFGSGWEAKTHTLWKDNFYPPTFDDPGKQQADNIRKFTLACAIETRKKLMDWYNDPWEAITHSINAVYALWMASVCRLRPSIEVKRTDNGYKVAGEVRNMGEDAMREVKARLTILKNGTDPWIIDPGVIDVHSGIRGNQRVEIPGGWSFQMSAEDFKKAKLRLEMIGHCKYSPDAQYVRLEQNFKQEWPRHYKGRGELETTMDCSLGQIRHKVCKDGEIEIHFILDEPNADGRGAVKGWALVGGCFTVDDHNGVQCKPCEPKRRMEFGGGTHQNGKFFITLAGGVELEGSYDDDVLTGKGVSKTRQGFSQAGESKSRKRMKVDCKLAGELDAPPAGEGIGALDELFGRARERQGMDREGEPGPGRKPEDPPAVDLEQLLKP